MGRRKNKHGNSKGEGRGDGAGGRDRAAISLVAENPWPDGSVVTLVGGETVEIVHVDAADGSVVIRRGGKLVSHRIDEFNAAYAADVDEVRFPAGGIRLRVAGQHDADPPAQAATVQAGSPVKEDGPPASEISRQSGAMMQMVHEVLRQIADEANMDLPNVPIYADGQAADDGGKQVWRADKLARVMAQELIKSVREHDHLRQARIALLFVSGWKPSGQDKRLELGKASKSNAILRLLAEAGGRGDGVAAPATEKPDFVVRLNGDWWGDADTTDDQRMALLDHQLSHCGVTVAARVFGGRKRALKADAFAGALPSVDLIGQSTSDDGEPVVHYRKRRGKLLPEEPGYADQPYAWRIRKHEVEEFYGVAERWGCWTPQLGRLADVIERVDGRADGDGRDNTPLLDYAEGDLSRRSPLGTKPDGEAANHRDAEDGDGEEKDHRDAEDGEGEGDGEEKDHRDAEDGDGDGDVEEKDDRGTEDGDPATPEATPRQARGEAADGDDQATAETAETAAA